ncbi:MAG: gamma-glutamyltransferase [Aestuariibacter sp.]|uniref:gamma-glutamyltransferase n=1 Tax=Marisediminitalea aggregata TaxID=634436 RepID=UPI0020CED66A|nr:gamma-glutamyltransferase [Marisediminitalea aggregata]MCP3862836.1 gamma-glutamyltransferase [Aestuariibacter sp.]MCP4529499.1 gamma-glutamyltransferase [Aestuariibacter sp.]MCP9477009.1 gamma-glutamyltransferase [Marisediminitalea aggregata]
MRILLITLGLLGLVACSNQPTEQTTSDYAVAMPDKFGAQVAIDVLEQGGNAVDAAIAAQFTLAVTYPEAGNIGGGGFMTIYIDGQPDFLDYREMAPEAASRDMYLDEDGNVHPTDSLFGAKASGIPGTVAGMWEAHQKYGKLPWTRLVQPAVTLAKDGFHVSPKLAGRVSRYIKRLRDNERDSNFEHYFGAATEAEALFTQPELAATLARIRDQGPDGFYKGDTADAIVAYMQKTNGLMTHDDLANYHAKWRTPLEFDWRGYKVVTAPPPSSGGIAVAQWLGMVDTVLKTNIMPAHNSAPYLHMVSEAGKRVFADRAEYLGDPDFFDVPQSELMQPAYIESRAKNINLTAISPTEGIAPGLHESEDTTHFSIVDKWGNAVSNTTTINLSFGAGVVAEGAGFLLNDEMDDFSAKPGVPNFFGAIGGEANAIEPYKRMLSSMTPTIVLEDDSVKLVTGSPGGTTIISSVTLSIFNTLLYGMTAEEAVNSPRFHHQLWPKDTIRVHDGFNKATLTALEALGYTIDDRRFGDLHLILNEDGKLSAASEKNGRGKAIVRNTQ